MTGQSKIAIFMLLPLLDCFASYKNRRVPRFYSKYFNLDSLGVDSLAFSWVDETCWLVPPVSLVKKVIIHVCLCRCRGILVVPYWPSAHYWLLLVERGGVFKSFFADCLYVENGKDVFFSMGGTRAPFLDQRILVPQCFFCCSTGLYGNLCRLLWSCTPLGRWIHIFYNRFGVIKM